ncbi:class I SAM-dependent methyltransferase [Candidatus Solirubrobacter pratensis]|uniref:class I SAM-dependent methyltransferase n=1 Tax=Candidatus Solirubrobacter pratensis TaxID=1298857 RepID=UPI0018C95641|nr:class I SAM-dependent methyltransferase [Candidatus Solirubrobacter pratensis]
MTATRRFNAPPAARYVHPHAVTEVEGEHDRALDIADEASPNYLTWIADLCRPALGARVLEVGAGFGAITMRYSEGRDVLATDISDECLAALHRRFDASPNVRVARLDIREPDPTERFDSALMVNVLEHIEDDAGALASLRRVVRPGGTIVLYVPALNGLYGVWDRKVGHFRRYSKWRVRGVAREAGLEVQELRYANILAIPAWFVFSRSKVETTIGQGLSLWDRTGVPLGRAIESRVPMPIGLNLLAVLRNPA